MSDTNIAPSVLKACPFCGSKPVVLPSGYTNCLNNKCAPHLSPAAWNRRPSDDPIRAEIIEECAKVVEAQYQTGDHELGHFLNAAAAKIRALTHRRE